MIARAVVLVAFGTGLLIFAFYLAALAVRDRALTPKIELVFGWGLVACRFAAGILAVWAGLQQNLLPAAACLGVLVAAELWRTGMRRYADARQNGGESRFDADAK